MSEAWKKHDRPCPPCANCGAELYEKFWGNGGWAKTDKATDAMHDASDCVKVVRATLDAVRLELVDTRKNLDECRDAWRGQRLALHDVRAWLLGQLTGVTSAEVLASVEKALGANVGRDLNGARDDE